ncbi:galaxin [Trichomycterus rosablanca]|uniref:galaxin n=1 Tax=Trichomycterus rosablanca TaxID=2290929 RepID=UPI002F360CFF
MEGLSQNVSKCCGSKAINPLNQICCQKRILNKTSAQSICCGAEQYEEKTHLCCGNNMVIHKKLNPSDRCCGDKMYSKEQHCNTSSLPEHQEKHHRCDAKKANQACSQNEDYRWEEDECHICCSGILKRRSDLTVCCGTHVYQLSEKNVLCCDGVLHRNQPVGSKCIGGSTYSPNNYTVCNKHAHLPAGQQCCGKDTFDPLEKICCNEHSHAKYNNGKLMSCCGSHAYDPSEHKCCAGHLHPTTDPKAECCGSVLLTDLSEQRCCSSDEKALVYKTQINHSCCGHWYYNVTLWSCCVQQLIPGPQNNSVKGFLSLRPPTDYSISTICNNKVFVGTVQSEAVKKTRREIVLTDVMNVRDTRVIFKNNTLIVEDLDHCSLPLLKKGGTYLWKETSDMTYEPMSTVGDLASVLHTLLNLCSSNN